MTINDKIKKLEQQVQELTDKLIDISANVEEKYKKPISIVGGTTNRGLIQSIDARSGRGGMFGGGLIWNNTEIDAPLNAEPSTPTIGYNKHSHSRYSGGALIKDVLEIVEYTWGSIVNKHSQQYWQEDPAIATEVDTSNPLKPTVEKIGVLDLIFNPSTKTWGCSAYELDIKKCYLVERDANGVIALDSKGQQKKSLLYNDDTNKTSVIWDESGNCFRFYSVYAPGE